MYLGDIDKGSQPILTPSSDDNIPDDKDHTPGSSMPYRESDNYEDDKFDSESEDGNEVVNDDQSDGQAESIAEEISTDEK